LELVVLQYDIYLINLDPTIGREIKKMRPCVVISPDEMNRHISTIIIAPMTTKSHKYPTRVPLKFKSKTGWIVVDQLRAVDKRRFIKKLGFLEKETIIKIKSIIHEMLVE
jgi:mRNA interferase MazF